MHNAALREAELPCVYLAFAVQPDRLEDALRGALALGMVGVNLTIPHKVAALNLMDWLDPEAQALGAVNTVLFQDGRMLGYNTDAVGFAQAMQHEGVELANRRSIVYGAGGAARAVVYALLKHRGQVTVINRTLSRAQELKAALAHRSSEQMLQVVPMDTPEEEMALRRADLVINATSLGMTPNTDTTPLRHPSLLRPGTTVVDLVYRPRETRLLREARRAGCRTVNGVSMLVHQGAESFRIWFHVKRNVAAMQRAVEEALAAEERYSEVSNQAVAGMSDV